MEHLKLYKQMQESDPSIDARWVPELERLVGLCQKNYKGNWQTMYHEYVSAAVSKDTGKHSPEQLRDMRRDTALILVIRQARGELHTESIRPVQKKVSELNLEDEIKGVRIGPKEVGGSNEYSLLLEVMREADETNLPLEAYSSMLFANKPARGLELPAWRRKVALVAHAQKIASSLGGTLEYNPKNEGIYVTFREPYAEHGQGD